MDTSNLDVRALLRERTLLDYPDELAPFGALVAAHKSFAVVGQLVAWLSAKDDPGDEYSGERWAVICIVSSRAPSGAWRTTFAYVPESELTVIAPSMKRPAFGAYLAHQILWPARMGNTADTSDNVAGGIALEGTAIDPRVVTESYQATAEDIDKLLCFKSPNPITVTLPNPVPAYALTKPFRIHNASTGALTVIPNGVRLDGKEASITLGHLEGVRIYTDGESYFSQARCIPTQLFSVNGA